MEKHTYFVTIDTPSLGIYDVRTPDNMIQYEIKATEMEKEELKKKMDHIKQNDFDPQQLMRPFHEKTADEEKTETGRQLREILEDIHRLGTSETKEILSQLL